MKKTASPMQSFLEQYDEFLLQRETRAVPISPRSELALPDDVKQMLLGGIDPQRLVRDTIRAVRDSHLRDFLEAVLAEPEVEQVLTTRRDGAGYHQRYAIEYLRRAAGLTSCWCAQGRLEREVMYVATLVEGLKLVLMPSIVGEAAIEDVVFTIVRPHLHRLDVHAPRLAYLLRLSLGWGNTDEIDDRYIPGQQKAIRRALDQAGLSEDKTLPVKQPLPN